MKPVGQNTSRFQRIRVAPSKHNRFIKQSPLTVKTHCACSWEETKRGSNPRTLSLRGSQAHSLLTPLRPRARGAQHSLRCCRQRQASSQVSRGSDTAAKRAVSFSLTRQACGPKRALLTLSVGRWSQHSLRLSLSAPWAHLKLCAEAQRPHIPRIQTQLLPGGPVRPRAPLSLDAQAPRCPFVSRRHPPPTGLLAARLPTQKLWSSSRGDRGKTGGRGEVLRLVLCFWGAGGATSRQHTPATGRRTDQEDAAIKPSARPAWWR